MGKPYSIMFEKELLQMELLLKLASLCMIQVHILSEDDLSVLQIK